MHNKSFTVDGVATIVGGRNIGDEYFGTGDGVQFIDLDVFAIGPVVDEVGADFERYWSSAPARPLARVLGTRLADPGALVRLAGPHRAMPDSEASLRPRCVTDLLCGCIDFEWAQTRLIEERPLGAGYGHQRLVGRSCARSSAHRNTRCTWCRRTSCRPRSASNSLRRWCGRASRCRC